MQLVILKVILQVGLSNHYFFTPDWGCDLGLNLAIFEHPRLGVRFLSTLAEGTKVKLGACGIKFLKVKNLEPLEVFRFI